MEIFIRGIPELVNEKHLKKQLRPVLESFQITVYECQKAGAKNAKVTVADVKKAQRVLDMYEQQERFTQGKKKFFRSNAVLRLFGFPVKVSKSHNEPHGLLIQSLLEEEEAKRAARFRPAPSSITGDIHRIRRFFVGTMSCGSWDYRQNRPVFVEFFRLPYRGAINLGKTTFKASLSDMNNSADFYIEVPYWNVDSIYMGAYKNPSITITTDVAPKLYVSDSVYKMMIQMQKLLKPNARSPPPKKRVGFLLPAHEKIAGRCFSYRFALLDPRDVGAIRNLGNGRNMPKIDTWNDNTVFPRAPYALLEKELESHLGRLPLEYCVKFQLQKLIWNGEISLDRAFSLFAVARKLCEDHESNIVAQALSRLHGDLSYPSPGVLSSEVGNEAIAEMLENIVESILQNGSDSNFNIRNANTVHVHRATVTPCGIYLTGPYAEAKNRILRKYADNVDYFLRVEFLDESSDPVYYDPNANLEPIFHERFAGIMKRGIEIAGRNFTFLGFSHSSLRSQTCWFSAPFTTPQGERLDARTIIRNIGHFDHILSPSKQAARIGQAFSDTLTSISISKSNVQMRAPDVKRNGRIFSDGVGVISRGLMYKIWNEYALREKVKPTVFQIRIAGAKGMVSLDTRLQGEFLMLRESMVKFPTDDSYNIEICGAGIKALPFYLNSQIIKILEDLRVPFAGFHQLQADEINSLFSIFDSTTKASRFLEESPLPKALRLSWLLLVLEGLGVRHTHDPFLHRVIEMTALLKLRDLKYRARIRVPDAVTLYGIMDETGYLQEGEIYCVYLSDSGHREVLVRENIVVTRSPALHPGDVQLVNAVDVPPDSPLRKLHNCVAFSQYGSRDLPSKLSGGDLDGDLYNVIYDSRLIPPITHEPADYPLVKPKELDRKVEVNDIIDFFVTFMQQDQLGRIATTHQAIADQSEKGTGDENCLKLANLHSVAVDYSKSGIPVDVMQIPRAPQLRPDFMAPGPRIRIEDSIEDILQASQYILEEDDDDDDNDRPKLRYYKSHNFLGYLYRSIDEQSFLLRLRDVETTSSTSRDSPLQLIWRYVEKETEGFLWRHLTETLKDTREIYEDGLREMMRQYSATPWKSSVTEYEIIVGSILGHGNKQRRRDKENSKAIREEYNSLIELTLSMIRDTESGGTEALERSLACFWMSINEQSIPHRSSHRHAKQDKLLSFPWIAAMACLQEVDRFQRSTPF